MKIVVGGVCMYLALSAGSKAGGIAALAAIGALETLS